MATLVFRLKYVPDEEADDIRQLLFDNDIPFYETSAGRWQISLAGIWVKEKEQAKAALLLIREDQAKRVTNRKPPTPWEWLVGYVQHARQNPAESLFTLVAILMILTVSVLPFWAWL
ncbi:DUF6164 family protein [Marinomonas pollencensis]|uniref:Uncharacterized protein n=1 Tax=Marinomonas pollencensis TaxID=491954 RepID=A0A3E0DLL2_9GAMM|nr:DUF6164 family protein [Marinomonas pollencensis]REG82403.1 hypothetical protein DFP81_10962 [Marinomonas pollencensis]